MPRIDRGLRGGHIYHALNRGNAKSKIFHKPHDYHAFIEMMEKAKNRIPIKILAYCLMPNHFHIVVQPPEDKSLSNWVQQLLTTHVRRFHKHYGTSGHVWQGRFKSFLIQEDAHLLTVLRYVERNPVRANLVESVKDWPWSSYHERTRKPKPYLLDPSPIELPENWMRFVNTPLTEAELKATRQSVTRQSPYGSPSWQRKVASKFGLNSSLRPRGRPRKERLI